MEDNLYIELNNKLKWEKLKVGVKEDEEERLEGRERKTGRERVSEREREGETHASALVIHLFCVCACLCGSVGGYRCQAARLFFAYIHLQQKYQ